MSIKIPSPPKNRELLYEYVMSISSHLLGADLLIANVINSGVWNMDSTSSLVVSLGNINYKAIKKVSIIILNDGDTVRYDTSLIEDGISSVSLSPAGLTITRKSSGFFDSTDFNDASQNRAVITVWR